MQLLIHLKLIILLPKPDITAPWQHGLMSRVNVSRVKGVCVMMCGWARPPTINDMTSL